MLYRRAPPEVATDAQVAKRLERYVSAALNDRLFPFQRAGVRFGVKHKGRVMLADEMGLGKTVQVPLHSLLVQALMLTTCHG